MSLSAIVRALVQAGATPEMILAAVEAAEAANDTAIERRRASDARRQRESRERRNHVMSRDVTVTECDPFPSSLPPTPPNLSTKPKNPPIIPPKPAKSEVAGATESDFEAGWKACTDQMRKRAGSKAIALAEWRKVCRRVPSAELLARLRRYLANDPDVSRTGGPGFQRWLRDGKFEAWGGGSDPPVQLAQPITPEIHARRVQRYRDTGEWLETWGPKPEDIAA